MFEYINKYVLLIYIILIFIVLGIFIDFMVYNDNKGNICLVFSYNFYVIFLYFYIINLWYKYMDISIKIFIKFLVVILTDFLKFY